MSEIVNTHATCGDCARWMNGQCHADPPTLTITPEVRSDDGTYVIQYEQTNTHRPFVLASDPGCRAWLRRGTIPTTP